MSGPVAVVVGAGSGLGQATAVKLASGSFTVVAVDRSKPGLQALPKGVHREVADATDPSAARPLLERITAQVGPPAVLVNTIGAYGMGDALSATPESLNAMIDVNVGPALWLTQAVAPYMAQQGSGAIVHVAARHAAEPIPGYVTYSTSKAALVHLVRILDAELRPQGVRVNAVAPAVIATEFNKRVVPPEVMEHAVAPEAIADVIAFLVSDAAWPISGAIVPTYGT